MTHTYLSPLLHGSWCGVAAILCKPETSVGQENSILDVVVAVVPSPTASVDLCVGGRLIALTWISSVSCSSVIQQS